MLRSEWENPSLDHSFPRSASSSSRLADRSKRTRSVQDGIPREDRGNEVFRGNPETSGSRSATHFDWRSWLALAWAGWFGLLYTRMILESRAPGVLHAVERLVGVGLGSSR
jgi:hypothetical protein